MREKEICPSVQSCNILIDGYGRSRQFEKCLQILEEMENNGLRPNVISYGSLLNCLCKDGRLLEAEVLFKHMASKAFQETNTSLKYLIVTLNAMFGINTLVNAACLGIVSPTNPQMPVDNKYSSLKVGEMINILRGDQRLTKASWYVLFWGAIWHCLENKGWHKEKSKNQGYNANSKTFLVPGYKFSEGLVKRVHYFDSVFELLSKVAREHNMIGIEDHRNSALVVDTSIFDGKLNQVSESRISPKSDREMLQVNRETRASVDPNLTPISLEIGSEQRQQVAQQSNTNLLRMQSTRNRLPTTRVLDAWTSGFLTVKSGQKRKCQETYIRQPDEQIASTNILQRHSTKNRQPTTRALEAFANGYIAVNSRQKRKCHQATRCAAIE
ncbi:unnamed protein product [Fraxinus pennsylvanica]|uniref:DUF7650 domain-containing protein n=1 Tax=Fraxinus pennsylvanica TaxID=56036 RepID=A0AAD2DII4_9LAMI|nr:unnamed protein product [Fraxinus pennsylvanica]